MRVTLTAALGLAVAASLSAGPTAADAHQTPAPGDIRGTVIDSDGYELPGASITAIDQRGEVRRAVSGQGGHYRIEVPPGTHTVQVALPGFVTSTASAVIVESRRTAWHDAELRLGPTSIHSDRVATSTGAIAGRVVDESGGVLPGVTVVVSGPQDTKVFTDAGGRYRLDGLAPGPYRLNFSLPGFRPASTQLSVTPGRVTRIHTSLRLGLMTIIDYVSPAGGVAGALQEADVVAHVRLTRSAGVRVLNDSIIVTDHDAAVLAVVKADESGIAPGASIRFAQEGAGVWVEEGYRGIGIERPYSAGESFIAFLRRHKDRTLVEYRGASYMWPAKQGFVMFPDSTGTLPAGLRSPMRVEECLAALRKLLK